MNLSAGSGPFGKDMDQLLFRNQRLCGKLIQQGNTLTSKGCLT